MRHIHSFTFAFSFSAVNLSSVPRHTVIVLNHSGERKKIFSTDFFLVGAHVHCLDETDLNTGSIGLD